jgi:hypothetical protein
VLTKKSWDAIESQSAFQDVRQIHTGDIDKLVILRNQDGFLVVDEAAPAPAQSMSGAYHRLTPLVLGVGANNGLGFELVGYEYIGGGGAALRVTPLSLYGWSKSEERIHSYSYSYGYTATYKEQLDKVGLYWAPLWFRYYVKKGPSALWPYIGGTVAYHAYENDASDIDTRTGMRPAIDYGLDFGGKTVRGFIGAKTFFGFGGQDRALTLINAGFSIGWQTK